MNKLHAKEKRSASYGFLAAALLLACGSPLDDGQAGAEGEGIAAFEQSLTSVTCGPGAAGDWCGSQSNVRGGAPNTLYRCAPNSMATNPRVCVSSCVQRPGINDACARPWVASSVMDVARNGNFDGAGRLLWADGGGKLGGNRLPAAVKTRGTSLLVDNSISGTGSTAAVSCLSGATGDWCGSQSNVVGGQSNTLYRCTANMPATNARICTGSCVKNPGRNDTCSSAYETISVSDFQCAGFAEYASGAPQTNTWIRGDRAVDRCPVPGTVIATFDATGRYQGHTAIVVNCTSTSLDVFDANWIDSTSSVYKLHVGRHTFTAAATPSSSLSDARNYYVVLSP